MTYSVLKILYSNAGRYVSGEDMAKQLGISRTAIKKHIDKLSSLGYGIDAVKKAGYSLTMPEDILDGFSLRLFLEEQCRGHLNVDFLHTATSTNDLAKTHFGSGSGIVVAAQQSCGKGRAGRSFDSPDGGLYLSYYADVPGALKLSGAGRLTVVAAVAALMLCRHYAPDAVIKWPNDILCGGKKLCGILGETVGSIERLEFIILGIGININSEFTGTPLEPIAASLKQFYGKAICRAQASAMLTGYIESLMDKFYSGGYEEILRQYRENCITIGKRVRIGVKPDYTHTAVGTDSDGNLIVEDSGGVQSTVYFGDVSVKL